MTVKKGKKEVLVTKDEEMERWGQPISKFTLCKKMLKVEKV